MAFYRKVGFQEVGGQIRDVGGTTLSSVVMEKRGLELV